MSAVEYTKEEIEANYRIEQRIEQETFNVRRFKPYKANNPRNSAFNGRNRLRNDLDGRFEQV